jgi:magnesium transporter
MLYLSQLLGMPVEDLQGERVGKITDALISAAQVGQNAAVYPDRLLVEGEDEQSWLVSLNAIERLDDSLRLRVPVEQLEPQPAEPTEGEIYLARDVLDKQVIDIARKKAVRVNDICFGDDWQILGVDDSAFGLVRRIAPPWLLGASGRRVLSTLIPWKRIELVGEQNQEDQEEQRVETGPHPVVRSPSGHLADLHPADIAEIVHQLTPGQGARLIEKLDDETAADTMEEIDTERQRHILENIEAERAADILQAMGPDEAADLLAQLPEDRVQELLRLMNPEESEDVQELLEYEADTAGGLMTTDYIVLDQTRTVAEALASVRANILENDVRIAYIYCTEDETQEEQRVLGVVSLWDLLAADATQPLRDLMETDVVTVHPESDAHTVAEIMAKYNLLAVPVVNANGILEGVVTVDDALDVLLPPERRRRPPRMY